MRAWIVAALLCLPLPAMAESCDGPLSADCAKRYADNWIQVWNAKDIKAIMAPYSDDVEMLSPTLVTNGVSPTGAVKGKENLTAYWGKLLNNPSPPYELADAFAGMHTVTVHWRRPGRDVIEVMEFNAACKVYRVNVQPKG